jgi:hypothetical protein
MTRAEIDPGICGQIGRVAARVQEDGQHVRIDTETGCPHIRGLMDEVGPVVDGWGLCFNTPGAGPLYGAAPAHLPPHGGCPVLAGIIKCVEAECGLALKKDAGLRFLE